MIVKLVPYVKTVIEHKAPTDDSIRLYEEIKTKAYQSILDKIIVNNNTLNLSAVIVDNHEIDEYRCFYKVTLNNVLLEGDVRLPMRNTKERLYLHIFNHASEHIARELIGMLNEPAMRKL